MADRMQFDLSLRGDMAAKLKEAAKAASGLGDDLDKTKTKGERIADGIRAGSQAIVAEAKQAQTAIDALSSALGPELTAKANAGGAGVAGLVQDLNKVGLTYQEIAQDADKLGAAMRDADTAAAGMTTTSHALDDVEQSAKSAADAVDQLGTAGSGIDKVSGGATKLSADIDKVGHSADRTRSVVANFTGNALQEIPGLSAAMGPLNMAIGQFGEYAAEGNIGLRNFAAAGLGLGAVSVVLGGISKHMEDIARKKAFDTARIDLFTKALQDGKTAAEAWDAALSKDKKVAFVDAATGKVKDLTHTLAENGITWAEFNSHLNGGQVAFEAWANSIGAGLKGSDDLNHIFQAGNELIEQQGKATKAAAEELFVFGDANTAAGKASADARKNADEYLQAIQDTTPTVEMEAAAEEARTKALEDATVAAEDVQTSIRDEATALREAAKAADDAAKAEEDRVNAMRASADANFAVADATDSWKESVAGLSKAVGEAQKNHKDLDTVYRANTQSAASFADDIVRLREEQDKSVGATTSLKDKTDLWNKSMVDMAATVKGPARQSILDFIVEANNIPDEKVVDIQAAAKAEDWAKVQAIIDETSKAREAAITAQAYTDQAKKDLDEAAKLERVADILANAIVSAAATALNMTAEERTAYILAEAKTAQFEADIQRMLNRPRFINITPRIVAGGDTLSVKGEQRARGGRIDPGRVYEVAENNQSEVLKERGHTYLIGGAPGVIIPLPDSGSPPLAGTAAVVPGGPGPAAPGHLQNISHTSTPAAAAVAAAVPLVDPQKVADDAKAAADAQIKEQDRVKAAQYELGRLTRADYEAYLKDRRAGAVDLSDDYLQLNRQINDLAEEEANALADLQKAQKDAAEEAMRRQDKIMAHEFENQEISFEEYAVYLRDRLHQYDLYSDQYFAISDLIQSTVDRNNARVIADQKAILDQQKAIYEQAQKGGAERDAGVAQEEATAAVFAAADKYAHAKTKDDKTAAMDEAVAAQTRLASALAATATAKAAAGGFEVGTVDWDRMMRGLLEEARRVFSVPGMDVVVGGLDEFLSRIPALATGGYVKGTPEGTIVRVAENNVGEFVGPGGMGGTNYHVVVNTGGRTFNDREARQLQEALLGLQRRNGTLARR